MNLKEIVETDDYWETGYFAEIDRNKAEKIKEKTKNFPFSPRNKKTNLDSFLTI